MGAFVGLNTIPENADAFSSEIFDGSCSKSMAFSVQANTNAMNGDTSSPSLTIMGSNISGAVADMVVVKDEFGNSAPMPLIQPFVKPYFPYKWIGIQYTHGTNVGTGTITVAYNQMVTGVGLE